VHAPARVRHLGRSDGHEPARDRALDRGFAAAGAAAHVHGGHAAAALLVGIGLGSLAWFTILSSAVSFSRRWLRPPLMRGIDVGAGLALTGFGAALGYRAVTD
jgi:threonine/homoserine/homoserine lactone efflux protein